MNHKMINTLRAHRARRNQREFDRALRSASPSMRQELTAAASRVERPLF
jgi:hypothetical protein